MSNITIKMDDISQIAATSQLWPMRGHAIQAYAALEQALCFLFAHLTVMSPDVAAIVFFKIASRPTRISLLDRLLHKRHGTTYSLFWNSYLKLLRGIDTKRDEIVHWSAAHNVSGLNEAGRPNVVVTLVPPNFWDMDANTPHITIESLAEFMSRCDVFSRLATMFTLAVSGRMPADAAAPWLDIFRQPLTYPLPADHLLLRKPVTQESQPPSSPA